jgi:hypothetical protein
MEPVEQPGMLAGFGPQEAGAGDGPTQHSGGMQVIASLAHHIDLEWMQEAYRRTRKDGAVGVDGR